MEAKFATKEDLKALEAKMATKEDLTKFATKEDLEIFGAKLRAEFQAEIAKQTRFLLTIMATFMVPIWAAMAAQFFA